MTAAHEMEEWKKGHDPDSASADDDETLLPEHEFQIDSGSVSASDDEDGMDDEELRNGQRSSYKSSLWVGLVTMATLAGRRTLTSGFPMYYVLLVQLGAYAVVAIVVLLIRLRNFRTPRRKEEEKHSWLEFLFIGFRILLSSTIASFAMLCGAYALLHFPNFPLLAMLPILTYAFDSILSRMADGIYLLPQDQKTSFGGVYRVVFVLIGVSISIYDDYRMDLKALLIALAGYFFSSLSKVVAKIGPRIEFKGTRTWETSLHIYLLAGLPPLVMASYATYKYENYVAASSDIAQSWSMFYRFVNFGPGVLLQILFASSMNTAYPFVSQEHVGGALEESSVAARDAAASTLQAGFWIICFGVLGREQTLIDWIQVISFMIIYIVSVSPQIIGYYPPRALNLLLRVMRRRQFPIHREPWQFKFFLLTTTTFFAVLMSSNIMFWVDTVAYSRSLRSWLGPRNLILDTTYRPPTLRSFDVVIAHSAGDPISSITDLISSFAVGGPIGGLNPKITVYTKDPSFNMTQSSADALRHASGFGGPLSIQTLRNIGGVSATHLHHILYAWDRLPVQTLFLTTSPSTFSSSSPSPLNLILDDKLTLFRSHLSTYFIGPAFPLPDAAPKTGFLNFGDLETCSCNQCFDHLGWEDSFHLVQSMWAAARPGSTSCDSVLLTRGNNFITSAARLRGVKRDVWELLHDALVNDDVVHAWAHDADKMPKMLDGEEGLGRWAKGVWVGEQLAEGKPERDSQGGGQESKSKGDGQEDLSKGDGPVHNNVQGKGEVGVKVEGGRFVGGGVYGEKDSLEKPYLGMTVERLWGVLLQCSEGQIAWRCPNLETGWRTGGEREDCGCVD